MCGGVILSPVQNKSRQGKEKVYHRTQDMNSTTNPESTVIILTQLQGSTLGLAAEIELICILTFRMKQ